MGAVRCRRPTALSAHEEVRPLLSGDRTGEGWFGSELARCEGSGVAFRLTQVLPVLPTELRSHFVPNCRCRDLGALAGDLPNC